MLHFLPLYYCNNIILHNLHHGAVVKIKWEHAWEVLEKKVRWSWCSSWKGKEKEKKKEWMRETLRLNFLIYTMKSLNLVFFVVVFVFWGCFVLFFYKDKKVLYLFTVTTKICNIIIFPQNRYPYKIHRGQILSWCRIPCKNELYCVSFVVIMGHF